MTMGASFSMARAMEMRCRSPPERLVVLLWETAGKPETALPSLYSDVPAEEIELQKATRWAIDNGLVKPADDSDASRFDPDRYVTKYDVFGAWLKLKKLMK